MILTKRLINVGNYTISFFELPRFIDLNIPDSELRKVNISKVDTPESVADNLYSDSSLDWLILYTAGIINEYDNWVKDADDIHKLCESKYEDGVTGINYYKSLLGSVVDHYTSSLYRKGIIPVPETVIPVTNYEHEMQLNEKRKTINVINPQYISSFLRILELSLIK